MRLVMPGRNVILDAAAMTETTQTKTRKPVLFKRAPAAMPQRANTGGVPVRNATHG
jgi:hypothetical protein